MSNDTIKKVLIGVVALVILIPLLPKLAQLMPEPVTLDAVEPAFTNASLAVSDVVKSDNPGLGAVEGISMTVNGTSVVVYKFDDEGKIATQLEYQKPDAGSAIVETWNLSESLGAAKPKNRPSSAARNGMFMITATGEDKTLNSKIVQIFKGL
ncbi:MAG: hypothetical protein NTZ09_05215 [Candidatus Hydrogenedentes bacterium]|nr:hypothetical protein [Candidatus Hydrogenedentota bacterium]